MLKWGRISLVAAIVFILSAAIHKILYLTGNGNELIVYLENIGFEAFFFFGALILSVSLFYFQIQMIHIKILNLYQ